MFRTRTLTAAIGATAAVAGLTLVGVGGTAASASSWHAQVTIAGSAAPFTSGTSVIGNAAAAQKLSIQVWLTPRTAAAQKYATAVSTPGNRLFHHYLSPAAYIARFNASKTAAAKVEAWLKSKHFTAIQADNGRSYIRATGSTAKIDAAFSTQLKLYRSTSAINAGPYQLRANSKPISVPADLASIVQGVTGLDNAAPIIPLDRENAKTVGHSAAGVRPAKAATAPCSQYYGEHTHSGPTHFGVTSWPTESCGYTATQMRAAYGANWTNTGKGQTVALVELGLTQDMFLTLQDYAAANGMPAPSSERYSELSLGQGTACGDDFDVEEQLDVESSYDMAPDASQLVIGGDSCNEGDFGLQGLFDADLAVLGTGGHPLATVASNSWEGDDEAQPAFLTNIEHSYLVRSAAEGVGMYFSAGDGSGVETPSSDPDAIGVGGTTLGIGKTNNRLFETGWSTDVLLLQTGAWADFGEQGASGGGPSILWKQPAFQKGVVPAALAKAPGNRGGTVRSAPDISADADPFTGFAVGLLTFSTTDPDAPPTFAESDIGGTSLASPLVAGITTAAQQGQGSSFGLDTPALYKLEGTSALFDPIPLTKSDPAAWKGTWCDEATCGAELLTQFDDQSFSMEGYTGQVTLKGYDNMTGVGAPDGQNFITALRALEK
jgi:subtilase family serine protease